MKRPVKIIGAVLLVAVLAFSYLRSADGKEVLAKAGIGTGTDKGAVELSTAENEEVLQQEESGAEGNGAEADAQTGENNEAELGFNEIQKQELKEIIGICLEENLNAMLEDGRLPAAIGTYAEVRSGLININTADEEELTQLNGIGPAKAAQIVKYREEHGAFQSVDDLTGVSGISTGTLEKLRDRVTL